MQFVLTSAERLCTAEKGIAMLREAHDAHGPGRAHLVATKIDVSTKEQVHSTAWLSYRHLPKSPLMEFFSRQLIYKISRRAKT
jgi:hypothetical protein